MDIIKVSNFIINIIDDKAVQIEFLRLTKKESNNIWISFIKTIEKLYDPFEIPIEVRNAITKYYLYVET